MSQANNNYVLIAGESSAGKTTSLMNLENHPGVKYLNCEINKPLPFRNQFQQINANDPSIVYAQFDEAEKDASIHTIVIDSATFMLDMYETMYVIPAADTRKAWGNYAQFWKGLMFDKIAKSTKRVIVLAHNLDILDQKDSVMKTSVPVKGSLKNQGIESYFSIVVYAKKMPIYVLEKYEEGNALLHISDKERALGYKHVFQTQITADTVNTRIRGPMGMFNDAETYIDNDAEQLLGRINEFYGS